MTINNRTVSASADASRKGAWIVATFALFVGAVAFFGGDSSVGVSHARKLRSNHPTPPHDGPAPHGDDMMSGAGLFHGEKGMPSKIENRDDDHKMIRSQAKRGGMMAGHHHHDRDSDHEMPPPPPPPLQGNRSEKMTNQGDHHHYHHDGDHHHGGDHHHPHNHGGKHHPHVPSSSESQSESNDVPEDETEVEVIFEEPLVAEDEEEDSNGEESDMIAEDVSAKIEQLFEEGNAKSLQAHMARLEEEP